MSAEARLRETLCDLAASLFQRGLTHGSTGNISARCADGGLLVSPTGTSFGRLDPARLARFDAAGRQVGGDPPTKEMPLHRAFYDTRSATGAVVHLHSCHAVALSTLPADDPQIAIGITIEYGGYGARTGDLVVDIANAYFAMQDGTLNEDGTIGKQETAADSTPADQTAPAQTETGTDTATDPAAGTTDAAQETAPAGQDALDN